MDDVYEGVFDIQPSVTDERLQREQQEELARQSDEADRTWGAYNAEIEQPLEVEVFLQDELDRLLAYLPTAQPHEINELETLRQDIEQAMRETQEQKRQEIARYYGVETL